jgi:hypothetical protein
MTKKSLLSWKQIVDLICLRRALLRSFQLRLSCAGKQKAFLKDKRVQIAFKDDRSLRRVFASISSTRILFVIDADLSGILLGLPDSPASESF